MCVVDIRTVETDVDWHAETLSKQDCDDAEIKRILRLDKTEAASAKLRLPDSQHSQETVKPAKRVGRDRFDVRRESARLEPVALIGMGDDDVFVEVLGVPHHALVIVGGFPIP
jgi:hypothetical protein